MFAAALGLLAAVVVAALFVLLARFYRKRTKILARARVEMDIFYNAAQRLLKDETLPESIAWFVEKYADDALTSKLAFRTCSRVLSGEFGKGQVTSERGRQVMADLSRLTDTQEETLADFVGYGLLVSAASAFWLGERLRQIVMFVLFSDDHRHENGAQGAPLHVASPEKTIDLGVRLATPVALEPCAA